ncbi:MAG: high-affinity iron permease, partial [Trebouxia sp. A1-2]
LVGRSFVGFESVGWFGYYGFPTSARPWQNQTLWNWSQKCNSNIQTNWECGILYAIFGYQDQGTAIWLFAYFGYWVEIFIVIAFKILSGTLLVAGVKKKQLRKPVLPKVADQVSSSPEDSSKVVSVPKGKEVQPSDFIVGHDTVQQKGKGKHMFEEQAEGSGSSGSSGSSSNPQLQHVEMAAMQVRH